MAVCHFRLSADRQGWAASFKTHFGADPLIDTLGPRTW